MSSSVDRKQFLQILKSSGVILCSLCAGGFTPRRFLFPFGHPLEFFTFVATVTM
jgi:hypothetical protein